MPEICVHGGNWLISPRGDTIRRCDLLGAFTFQKRCLTCAGADDGKTFISWAITQHLGSIIADPRHCAACAANGKGITRDDAVKRLGERAGREAVEKALIRAVERGMAVAEAERLGALARISGEAV